jgi:hypothetical protein
MVRAKCRLLALALIGGVQFSAAAETVRFKDWTVQTNDARTNMTATTVNDSGNEFGRICYFENKMCGWALLSRNTCVEEVETPVLVNSESGAWQLTVKCLRSEKERSVLMFSSSEELNRISASDREMGIAFPLQGGRFVVMRFSLVGSGQAVSAMEDIIANRPSSTKDMIL